MNRVKKGKDRIIGKVILASVGLLVILLGLWFMFKQPLHDYLTQKNSENVADQYISKYGSHSNEQSTSQNQLTRKLGQVGEWFNTKAAYATNKATGDELPDFGYTQGVVYISSVGIRLPIYRDTPAGLNAGAIEEIDNSDPSDDLYVLAAHKSYIPHTLFSDLFYVKKGARITVYNPNGEYVYKAKSMYVVDQYQNDVLTKPTRGNKIIRLFTCNNNGQIHPTTRYVVEGELVDVQLNSRGLAKAKQNPNIKSMNVKEKGENSNE